eukprot:3512879-Rhodomonas_salina.1
MAMVIMMTTTTMMMMQSCSQSLPSNDDDDDDNNNNSDGCSCWDSCSTRGDASARTRACCCTLHCPRADSLTRRRVCVCVCARAGGGAAVRGDGARAVEEPAEAHEAQGQGARQEGARGGRRGRGRRCHTCLQTMNFHGANAASTLSVSVGLAFALNSAANALVCTPRPPHGTTLNDHSIARTPQRILQ